MGAAWWLCFCADSASGFAIIVGAVAIAFVAKLPRIAHVARCVVFFAPGYQQGFNFFLGAYRVGVGKKLAAAIFK